MFPGRMLVGVMPNDKETYRWLQMIMESNGHREDTKDPPNSRLYDVHIYIYSTTVYLHIRSILRSL